MRIFLLLVLLSGCGVEENYEPLVEWSGNITEQSDRFILSYDTERFPESQLPKVEQWWIDVQECAGVSVDISGQPIIIEFTHPDKMPENWPRGVTDLQKRYSRVEDRDLYLSNGHITRHELKHHLAFIVEGKFTESSKDHTHEFFNLCGY